MDGLKISQGSSHSSDREWASRLKLKISQGSDHSDRDSPKAFAIKEMDDIFYSEDHRQKLTDSFKPLAEDKVRAGVLFYQDLFKTYPEVIPYFGRTDMDFLASHLFDAVELLVNVFNDFENALPVLRHLGKIYDIQNIPVFTYGAIGEVLDMTLRMALPQYGNGTPKGDAMAKL